MKNLATIGGYSSAAGCALRGRICGKNIVVLVNQDFNRNNEEGQSAKDLDELWARFYSEQISGKISNKETEQIYSIYTDYESAYRGGYTVIIRQKVTSLDEVPNGLIRRKFEGGNYLNVKVFVILSIAFLLTIRNCIIRAAILPSIVRL